MLKSIVGEYVQYLFILKTQQLWENLPAGIIIIYIYLYNHLLLRNPRFNVTNIAILNLQLSAKL